MFSGEKYGKVKYGYEMLYGMTPMGVGVHVRTVKVKYGDERWYTV